MSPAKRSYRTTLLLGFLGIMFLLNEYYSRPDLMASPDLFLKDDSPTKETTALLRADNDAAVNSNSPQPPYRGQPHDDTLAHSVH